MAWHTITALGQHTRSDYVGSGMTSPPLDRTHFQTTSGVACRHRLWTAHMVERRRAWHAIIAFRQHTRSNDVVRGMPPLPFGSRNGRTTLGEAFHHRHWTIRTVIRRRAWHDITALELHARSDDIGRGMTSPHLDSTHGWQCRAWHDITAFGQHTRSTDVGCGTPSSPLSSTHSRTTLGVA